MTEIFILNNNKKQIGTYIERKRGYNQELLQNKTVVIFFY